MMKADLEVRSSDVRDGLSSSDSGYASTKDDAEEVEEAESLSSYYKLGEDVDILFKSFSTPFNIVGSYCGKWMLKNSNKLPPEAHRKCYPEYDHQAFVTLFRG